MAIPSPTRRDMLRNLSCGFGSLALAGLSGISRAFGAVAPPQLPRARRVIFLCMPGGPAHLDTFDYKPQNGRKEHPGSAFEFARRGQSGLWVSELFPETAKHADKLCVLNGMHADTGNHAQSFRQLVTGERLRPRPSIGSWVNYGLASESENLPGFVSLNAHESLVHSGAFLPSRFGGTPIGVNGEDMSSATIPNIAGDHLPPAAKRRQLDLVQAMNREHLIERPGDAQLEGAIAAMELGFRMQGLAPRLLDLSDESPATLERYRVGKKIKVGTCRPSDFGRQCLLARRFAEAGVRFIQVSHSGWDTHKNHRRDLRANCDTVDAPIAALLEDLDQRGLLDDTLVMWGGEFGRPGLKPSDKKDETGHNPNGFTCWLAGGGVKRGFAYGATDETGAKAVDGRVHFHDLHATVLALLGLDPEALSFRHQGRDHRLTGPEGGRVVREIFA
jgi:hypothetical protein